MILTHIAATRKLRLSPSLQVACALLGMTVEQGMLITLAGSRLIVSDAGLPWVTLGQLLDAFNVWMPEISLGQIVACCLVLNAVASTSGQVQDVKFVCSQ